MAYGNDSQTVLLIHSHNVNGSTTFVDSSMAGNGGNRHTITRTGTLAKHSTAQKKTGLGNSSIIVDPENYLQIADHNDFYFGPNNFTIDFWFYISSSSAQYSFIKQYTNTSNYFSIDVEMDSIFLYARSGGSSILGANGLTVGGLNTNVWYHVALVRNSGNISFYIDGVLEQTNTTANWPDYSAPLNIGSFDGYFTELRISKGVARSDFPPSFPYTSSNHIVSGVSTQNKTATPVNTRQNLTVLNTGLGSFNRGNITYSCTNTNAGVSLATATTIEATSISNTNEDSATITHSQSLDCALGAYQECNGVINYYSANELVASSEAIGYVNHAMVTYELLGETTPNSEAVVADTQQAIIVNIENLGSFNSENTTHSCAGAGAGDGFSTATTVETTSISNTNEDSATITHSQSLDCALGAYQECNGVINYYSANELVASSEAIGYVNHAMVTYELLGETTPNSEAVVADTQQAIIVNIENLGSFNNEHITHSCTGANAGEGLSTSITVENTSISNIITAVGTYNHHELSPCQLNTTSVAGGLATATSIGPVSFTNTQSIIGHIFSQNSTQSMVGNTTALGVCDNIGNLQTQLFQTVSTHGVIHSQDVSYNLYGQNTAVSNINAQSSMEMSSMMGGCDTEPTFNYVDILPQAVPATQEDIGMFSHVDVPPQTIGGFLTEIEAIAGQCHNYHDRCAKLVNSCDLKRYFNLAEEVPDSFLNIQIHHACLQLYKDTGIPEKTYPINQTYEWQEAQRYLAFAYALPHLHTFTMQGAARAQGLATQLNAVFLNSTEIDARVIELKKRYRELVDILRWPRPELVNPYNNPLQWIAI